MPGQTEYVASFPGVHFREWGRVTLVMKGKSVACVFVPGGSLLYGNHDEDPDHPGKCFCQSFLPVPGLHGSQGGFCFVLGKHFWGVQHSRYLLGMLADEPESVS